MTASIHKRGASQELLERLRRGDERAMEEIYLAHRADFLGFAQRQGLEEDAAADVFQDACVALYENAVTGKLVLLTASLKTYLFGIGKRLLYARYRTQAKLAFTALDEERFPIDDEWLHREAAQDRRALLTTLLRQTGASCRRLLELFYFRQFAMERIAKELGMANENTAKAAKSRCLRTLRERALAQGLNA